MASNRNRAWADTRFNVGALVAGTPQIFDLLAGAPTVDTLTAVRIIGDLEFQYTPNLTVSDSLSVVDVGIGVCSTEAFSSGFDALPRASDSANYPTRGWLYVSTRPVTQLVTADTGIIDRVARFQFDLRAMRKIDKGILYLEMEQANIIIGGVMNVVGRTRVLCLT